MIDINRLAYICEEAREQMYIKGIDPADITVTLNRDTYIKLFDYLRSTTLFFSPLEGLCVNTFLFQGCRVSWSPMHDVDPIAYAVGYLEFAH